VFYHSLVYIPSILVQTPLTFKLHTHYMGYFLLMKVFLLIISCMVGATNP